MVKGSDEGLVLFSNSSLREIVRPVEYKKESDKSLDESNFLLEKLVSTSRRRRTH